MPCKYRLLSAALLLWLGIAVAAADTLATRLSDAAFWQFIEEASEPGGAFESDNWISNETGVQNVIPQLQQRVNPGGVYIGVGPEQNFTYIAALRPKIAFIIDIRRQNTVQHLLYKALFETSLNRAAFLSKLFSRPQPAGLTATATVDELFSASTAARPDERLFRSTLQSVRQVLLEQHRFVLEPDDLRTLERILSVFRQYGPGVDYNTGKSDGVQGLPSYTALMTARAGDGRQRSFLASEENYAVVRDLQLRNLIIPVTGDFAGSKAVRSVGRYLKEHEATVGAFYTSNVEGYLFRTTTRGFTDFYENIATLPLDSRSTFIRSGNVAGPLQPGGMPITSLSSMQQNLAAVRNGEVQRPRDLLELSN